MITALVIKHLVASHFAAGVVGFVFHVAWRRAIGPAVGSLADRLLRNLF